MSRNLFFITVCFVFLCAFQSKQSHILELHLEGVKYDTLVLGGENVFADKAFKVYGLSNDGDNWKFIIPDSIYNSAAWFEFFPKKTNQDSNFAMKIILYSINNNGDTIKSSRLYIDENITQIHAKFSNSLFLENLPTYTIGKLGEGEMKLMSINFDNLIIPFYKNSEFEIQANNPYFSSFWSEKENLNYDEFLQKYIDTISKHPDSRYLICNVASNVQRYKLKEYLQKTFNMFSEKNQTTTFGEIINDYLNNYFEFKNIELINISNSLPEYVIQNSTKPNLIIFSASWCAPCRAEVPVLKEIYADLGNNISMTYISMDDTTTVKNWENFMIEEKILWRSLLAKNNLKEVKKQYTSELPAIFLIMPNSDRIEKLDVRDKKDKDKLYQLLNKTIE